MVDVHCIHPESLKGSSVTDLASEDFVCSKCLYMMDIGGKYEVYIAPPTPSLYPTEYWLAVSTIGNQP